MSFQGNIIEIYTLRVRCRRGDEGSLEGRREGAYGCTPLRASGESRCFNCRMLFNKKKRFLGVSRLGMTGRDEGAYPGHVIPREPRIGDRGISEIHRILE